MKEKCEPIQTVKCRHKSENAFRVSTKCAQTMQKEGVPPSPKIYTTAITACSRTADWKRALLLLVEMRKAFPSRSLHTALTTMTPLEQSSAEANSASSGGGVGKVIKFETPKFSRDVENLLDLPALPPSEVGGGAEIENAVANKEAKSNDYQRQKRYQPDEKREFKHNGVPDWWGRGNVHQMFGFGAATAVASRAAAKADGRRRHLKESRSFSDADGFDDIEGLREPTAIGGFGDERGGWERVGGGADEKKSKEILDARRAAYNAAINVCGRAGRWDRALDLLEVGFSSFVYNLE